jgi:ribosomal protein S18 acetylase RimI-like enzyme
MDLYINDNFQLKNIENELGNPYSKYLLIQLNEEWAGYALLRWDGTHKLLEDMRALKLHRIYMLQKFWGQQLGSILLEYILHYAIQEKYEWLWLVVWQENPRAIRFYEKWGFEHFGYETFKFGEEVTNDWAMRKKLL